MQSVCLAGRSSWQPGEKSLPGKRGNEGQGMATDPQTKRDRILENLRRRILSNEFPRGARLRQDDLAQQLSSSITPVREALRILEAEGLVVSEPHKGVRVAGIDLQKTKATYIIRRLVESYAMCRATMRMSQLDIKQAWSFVDEMQKALDEGDPESVRRTNKEFHFHFYDRCGLPALSNQIANMWRSFPWDLSLDSLERGAHSQREHVAIVKAVETGDLNEVARTTEAHIERGLMSILRKAAGVDGPDPFRLEVD